jgi:hypothetical protein
MIITNNAEKQEQLYIVSFSRMCIYPCNEMSNATQITEVLCHAKIRADNYGNGMS